MKFLPYFISFLIVATNIKAIPKYILIRKGFLKNPWELIHLDKQPQKLHKWKYDSQTDTYYRMKGLLGYPIKIITNKKAPVAQPAPDYILIRARFLWGFKLAHVEKAPKKIRKWHYDSKTNTYYRIQAAGIGAPLKIPAYK